MPAAAVYSILNKKENAHDEPIYSCVWAKINITGNPRDSKKDFLITGGLDSKVKVWHFEKNKLNLLHALEGHCMAVVSLAISPDGQKLASTSLDSTLIIWEVLSGRKVHEIKTGATDVWKVAFSPGGFHVVTGGHTGKLYVYDIVDNVEDKVLDTRGKFALSVAWSNSGKYIASGSVDGYVCVFNVVQGKLVHTIEAHTHTVRSVDFSPDSELLVSASDDGYVKLFDVGSGNLLLNLNLKSWVLKAVISYDCTRVAAAAADGSVTIANLKGFKTAHMFNEHKDMVWDLQFNFDSNMLVSVSKDKSLNVYECPLPKYDKK
ncbi:WD repeat-containing protein 61-like [Aricia agestis]|uniref:WD repeat-containing protein 61-like n=1 Tax=Aricia agestis TaxID=91739 RepID=UPI001C209B5A|nr:WD repeat-containing protein 61-like [Aricia agestis]